MAEDKGTIKTLAKDNKTVGDFLIGKTLGEGTFGLVKLGTHVITGENVAIKILEKLKIINDADKLRVDREIKILKSLLHHNLVQLYSVIETPMAIYMIMEYANGGELFDYIVQKKRLNDQEACKFYRQLISGIDYLHQIGVCHRDLKPENLLLDHNKDIKIVDFGLSNMYVSGEQLKTPCGSPCYAAPEMIKGHKYNGLTVDLWSSGIILFAMLCGYLPFDDPNTDKLYKKIIEGKVHIPDFVSEPAKDLIRKVLNTDTSKRYTIEQIMSHPWFNIRASLPINIGLKINTMQIPIDLKILSKLKEYNFNIEEAMIQIRKNNHTRVTTTYYLLLKNHIKKGGFSISDKVSQEYINFVKNQNKTEVSNEDKKEVKAVKEVKGKEDATKTATSTNERTFNSGTLKANLTYDSKTNAAIESSQIDSDKNKKESKVKRDQIPKTEANIIITEKLNLKKPIPRSKDYSVEDKVKEDREEPISTVINDKNLSLDINESFFDDINLEDSNSAKPNSPNKQASKIDSNILITTDEIKHKIKQPGATKNKLDFSNFLRSDGKIHNINTQIATSNPVSFTMKEKTTNKDNDKEKISIDSKSKASKEFLVGKEKSTRDIFLNNTSKPKTTILTNEKKKAIEATSFIYKKLFNNDRSKLAGANENATLVESQSRKRDLQSINQLLNEKKKIDITKKGFIDTTMSYQDNDNNVTRDRLSKSFKNNEGKKKSINTSCPEESIENSPIKDRDFVSFRPLYTNENQGIESPTKFNLSAKNNEEKSKVESLSFKPVRLNFSDTNGSEKKYEETKLSNNSNGERGSIINKIETKFMDYKNASKFTKTFEPPESIGNLDKFVNQTTKTETSIEIKNKKENPSFQNYHRMSTKVNDPLILTNNNNEAKKNRNSITNNEFLSKEAKSSLNSSIVYNKVNENISPSASFKLGNYFKREGSIKGGDGNGLRSEAKQSSHSLENRVNNNTSSQLKDKFSIKTNRESESEAIRLYDGPFDIRCLTMKAPKFIKLELIKVMLYLNILAKACIGENYKLKCSFANITFEVEINRVIKLSEIYLIRFERASGSLENYQDICEKVINQLKL